ncbi:MAG: UvrD-helicase domain-containing protein [Leptospira sp.]|nr:UvrD-helicase domain-containing protein [Leptospira sp.]
MSHPLVTEPNFIEASAGTGKTFRIMEMLEQIMREDIHNKVSHNRLLKTVILTFTEKAAGELKARLKKKILELYKSGANSEFYPYLRDLDQIQIATIHGFCNLVLNEYPIETGTIGKPRLTSLDEVVDLNLYFLKRKSFGIPSPEVLANLLQKSVFFEKEDLLKSTAKKILSDTKEYFYPAIGSSPTFLTLTSDSEVSAETSTKFLQWVTLELVKESKITLAYANLITYDQMILKLRSAIDSNPSLLASLQERFEICLLDEFQDTDKNQYEIFKSIFVKKEKSSLDLYCIGDPKQSIYSFRGADIGVYLKAKNELVSNPSEPSKDERAQLVTNYRSSKDMIGGYNTIFFNADANGQTNFFPIQEPGFDPSHYKYQLVQSPHQNSIKYELTEGERAIHVIELQGNITNMASVKEIWEKFISEEIPMLIDENNPFNYNYREKEGDSFTNKKIKLSDIAVLCESNKAALQVERDLTQLGIPCSIYKRKGIYQSDETDQILNVLECLQEPNKPESYRKILYSELFGIHPIELNRFDEYTIESYEKKCIDLWVKYSREHKFAECFRSILDETRVFWNTDLTKLQWERKRTNYKQIFQKLLEYQLSGNYGLVELIAELKKWKLNKASEEEQPLYDRETEEDAVQILTIHSSKGLEWPVVFLYCFGSRKDGLADYEYPFVSEENGSTHRKWMMKLFEPEENNLKIKKNPSLASTRELNHYLNEKKRLLYVAITRPNVRLYLPFVRWGRETETNNLYSFQNTAYGGILYGELKRIKETNANANYFSFRQFPTDESSGRTLKKDGQTTTQKQKASIYPNINFDSKRFVLQHSYSGLKTGHSFKKTNADTTGSEQDGVHDNKNPSNIDEVPSSSTAGNLMHKILETIEYSIFDLDEARILKHPSWKDSFKQAYRLYPISNYKSDTPIELAILRILKNAMTNPFVVKNRSIALKDLSLNQRSNELKFQIYLDKLIGKKLNDYPTSLAEIQQFLKGAIDLVFELDGLYYIADFKSDKLPKEGYSPASLDIAIEERGYSIQKEIYAFVLFEYLASIFGEEEALKKFGGVLYFFLRGMKDENGVYSDLGERMKWDKSRFLSIRENILTMVLDTSTRWIDEI